MDSVRAIRLAAADIWEESGLLLLMGFVGGVLSLLVVSLPLVTAVFYATTAKITENRVVAWQDAVREGRANARFYYFWFLVLLLPSLLLGVGIVFYGQLASDLAQIVYWLSIVLLVIWLLPQPLIPALYWQQDDRRLKTALRNAYVLTIRDPLSLLIFWLVTLGLAAGMAYVSWPFLFLLPGLTAVYSTRLLWLKLNPDSSSR